VRIKTSRTILKILRFSKDFIPLEWVKRDEGSIPFTRSSLVRAAFPSLSTSASGTWSFPCPVVADRVVVYMVHVGSDLANSACFTKPKARVEGQTVLIVGYRTLREQSREFVVRLPATASLQSVSVVWVDPDGSRIAIPITK